MSNEDKKQPRVPAAEDGCVVVVTDVRRVPFSAERLAIRVHDGALSTYTLRVQPRGDGKG